MKKSRTFSELKTALAVDSNNFYVREDIALPLMTWRASLLWTEFTQKLEDLKYSCQASKLQWAKYVRRNKKWSAERERKWLLSTQADCTKNADAISHDILVLAMKMAERVKCPRCVRIRLLAQSVATLCLVVQRRIFGTSSKSKMACRIQERLHRLNDGRPNCKCRMGLHARLH